MPDPVDTTKMLAKMIHGITDDAMRSEKASKGIAENFDALLRQLTGQHSSIMSFFKETIKLPAALKGVSTAIVTPLDVLKQKVADLQHGFDHWKEALQEVERRYDRAIARGTSGVRIAKEMAKVRERFKGVQQEHDLARASVMVHEEINKVLGKRLAIEYAVLHGFKLAVRESQDLSKTVLDTNVSFAARVGLFRSILEAQTKTGSSTQHMLTAAKALRGTGLLFKGDVTDTLSTVVQMERGLGVSADNAAQLARIFQINLVTPVRQVADDITRISEQTSLAADEATRYATEVGKALRLLGPGGATQAREVTRYVTEMAARMKDVGGDANDIIKMFSEMTKGTTQAFVLRGMAGVNSPGAFGTVSGAQRGIEGVGRVIDKIVKAAPGTIMYTAQLELASQALQMSTDSVMLYKQMLEAANKPLDANTTLQKHWEKQMAQTGEVISNLMHTLGGLVKRGFIPVIEHGVLPVLKGLESFVTWLSRSKTALYLTAGALVVGIGYTTYALGKLSLALATTAMLSHLAAKAERARQLELGLGMVAGRAGFLSTLMKMGGPLAMFSRALMAFLPVLTGPIGIAGLITIGVVTALNTFFPSWLDKLIDGFNFLRKKDTTKTAFVPQYFGKRSLNRSDFDAMITHAIAQGGVQAGMEMFRAQAWRVRGFVDNLPGARQVTMEERIGDYLDKTMPNLIAKVRERIALSTVTAERDLTARRDQEMISSSREQIKAIKEEVPKISKTIVEQRKAAKTEDEQKEQKKEMLKKSTEALPQDPWAQIKSYHGFGP